ncbi:MAG: MelG protein (non-ribosomal peptide synthetase)-like protein, partial [Polaromonas sp.]|nr:MelG protein (non-ribosomal peptide synthetase)-like protein [Polaromonas sp.]
MTAKRAVFAGSTNLLIDCARTFRSAGHVLVHVITCSSAVQQWARDHGVPCSAFVDNPSPRLQEPFDVLFWVDGGAEPPNEWVTAARTLALQLHLTLEPPYTQPHAPSWAILDQKSFHGVTWRNMRAAPGQADVARQLPFGISRTDTAASLHAKCHEAGLAAFRSMLGDIGMNEVRLLASALSQPAGSARLLRAGGTVEFSRPAHEVVALVSALDFRPLPNAYVHAKVLLENTVALAGSAVALPGPASGPPGYLVRAEGDTLTIAAADHDVLISGCFDLSGQPAGKQLSAGTCLPQADEERLQALAARVPHFTAHEKFWRRIFADGVPVELPYPRARSREASGDRQTMVRLDARERSDPFFDFTAAFCAWLSALTACDTITVLYTDQALARQTTGLEAWLSCWVPLTLPLSEGVTSSQAAGLGRQKLAELHAAGPYLNDLPARLGLDASHLARLSQLGLNRRDQILPANMILMLSVVDDQQAALVADAAEFSPAVVQAMAEHFSAFARAFRHRASLADTPLLPP